MPLRLSPIASTQVDWNRKTADTVNQLIRRTNDIGTGTGTGTVTSVSVASANGLAGTVATATTTPALTLSTSVTGIVKGNGTALSAAAAATDYVAPSAYASANGLTMATARLLGRSTASTGRAEEIAVGTGLSLSAGTLSATGGGTGTVTSVSVASANGFAGTVATPTSTPAITLTTSITGVLKGNGTAISAASAGTDYVAPSAYASSNGHTMATARLLGRTTAGTGAAEEITVGAGLNMAAGVLAATGGGGSSYRLTTNTTPVGWVATTAAETDLMTYSLPAGTLAVNGQIARINMSGQGASSHSKTVKIYFGSAVLFTIGPSTTLTYWTVQVDVIRTGAATQVAQVNYHLSNSGGFAVAATAPAETLSGAITIKATGTSTSSSVTNEIMQNTLIVEILP